MQESTLKKEYYDNKLTQREIGLKYGVSRQLVNRYFKKYNLSPLNPYERCQEQELTQIQHEFLIGTMLGDGCLQMMRGSKNAWLTIKHCSNQKEYVEWKYDIIKPFNACEIKYSVEFDERYKKDREKYYFRTICHPIFTAYHKMFYEYGVKTITNEITNEISPLSIATWFMDDGYKSGRYLAFCTHSFTSPELERLRVMLDKKFNISTVLWSDGYRKGNNQKMYKIAVTQKSVPDLIDIMKPYIIESMKYKIDILNGTSETTREAPSNRVKI